jgi:hypothetical protein
VVATYSDTINGTPEQKVTPVVVHDSEGLNTKAP